MNGLTLSRKVLAKTIASETGISLNQCEKLLSSMINNTTHELKNGNSVTLGDLVTLFVHHKKGREGRNPKTKELHDVTPRTVVIARFEGCPVRKVA